MNFQATPLPGAFVVEPERKIDERGFFARTWCQREFQAHGITMAPVQCSVSFNRKKGTLRGLHYQESPEQEAKLVRCTRGAIYDVIVDLRHESPMCNRWIAAELTAENRLQLYVPEGFAHGFQTLAPDTEVYYQISKLYRPDTARGIRWNDPALAIVWPEKLTEISIKDSSWQDYLIPPPIAIRQPISVD